jgi:hypothetical protein
MNILRKKLSTVCVKKSVHKMRTSPHIFNIRKKLVDIDFIQYLRDGVMELWINVGFLSNFFISVKYS